MSYDYNDYFIENKYFYLTFLIRGYIHNLYLHFSDLHDVIPIMI